jgi:ribonuclease HI
VITSQREQYDIIVHLFIGTRRNLNKITFMSLTFTIDHKASCRGLSSLFSFNIAEYEALLLRLQKLKAMGIRRAILKTDSQVISGHIDKSSKTRDPKLEKYLDTVRRLEASFEGFSVKNISRGENEHADLLAKSAAQGLPLPSDVFFETIKAPSVNLYWRTEIISFLQGNWCCPN